MHVPARCSRLLATGAAGFAVLVASGLGAAPARASLSACESALPPASPSIRATGTPLRFGIYPGGPVGTVSATAQPVPENPGKRLSALQQLRSGHPLVAHIYDIYTGGSVDASFTAEVAQQIDQYTTHGILVELVDEYRPADANPSADVPGFVGFVRETVRSFGGNPRLVSLQVTNEANMTTASDASDGYYPGVDDALIAGVEAAGAEISEDGYSQLQVGFNWAYLNNSSSEQFFAYLGQHGGGAFAQAVDWVGVDAYPATWGSSGETPAEASSVMVNSLRVLRECLLPLAGIPNGTPLHVSESGYPTSATRSPAAQASYLRAEITAVSAFRTQYNVSDYRWFDLRDSNTGDPNFESHYGLLLDDYSPKPAFSVFQRLIARLGPATTRRTRAVASTHSSQLVSCLRPGALTISLRSGPSSLINLVSVSSRGRLLARRRFAPGKRALRVKVHERSLSVRLHSNATRRTLTVRLRIRGTRPTCAVVRI